MKKKFLALTLAALAVGALSFGAIALANNQQRIEIGQAGLQNHEIVLNASHRKNVRWEPDDNEQPDDGGYYYFDLATKTEHGNDFESIEDNCYVYATEKANIDISSNDYLFKLTNNKDYGYCDFFNIAFEMEPDVMDQTLSLVASVSYGDWTPQNVEFDTSSWSSSYLYEMVESGNTSITVYSITINYQCTY